MSKKSRMKGSDYQRKEPKTVNSLSELKGAMAEVNATEAKNIATENSDAGAAARAEIVNKVTAKEDAGFTNPLGSNPKPLPGNPGKGKGRPKPDKKQAEVSAKATKSTVDLSTPEARHEVAEELKAGVVAKADGLFEEPTEDKDDEVIIPDNITASPAEDTGKPIITDSDDNPDDTNSPAAEGAGGEVVNEDAVATETAPIADDMVVNDIAAKAETIDPQEEPVVTGATENGGAEVKDEVIIQAQPEVTPVSELVEDAVTIPEPVVNVAAKAESEVVTETPEVSTPSEGVAAEEISMGFSSDQLRKLETAWLKSRSEVYKIKPREEITQMIIAEYANTPTDKIKGGDVIARCKAISGEIYAIAHPANQAKAAAKAERASKKPEINSDNATVSSDAPLSKDIDAVKADQNSSPEITSEAAIENPATTLNGVEEATVAPVEVSAKADETGEDNNPQSEEETTSITMLEAVDTSEPLEVAAKGIGETEVPTAPEADNSVAEVKAEGVATDEPVVTSETVNTGSQDQSPATDITEEEIVAAKAIDTAGTVGNTEVTVTETVNQQAEEVTSGEGANVPSEVTAKAEVNPTEATENSSSNTAATVNTDVAVETEAEVVKDAPSGELTEADVTKLEAQDQAIDTKSVGEVKEPETEVKQETVNGSPVSKKGGKPTHIGDINAMEMLLHDVLSYQFEQENKDNGKHYGAKEGHKMLNKWMKDNNFDPKSTSLDYFQMASKYGRENGFCVDEVTTLGFTRDNFRSRIAELFTDKRDDTSALVNALLENVPNFYAIKVTIPDNMDDLDLEETRKINRALRTYYERTIPIIEHVMNVQGNAKFSENKATGRQFITYREARTEQQAMEIARLNSINTLISSELGIARAKVVEVENRNEGLMDVITETLATQADEKEGVADAIKTETETSEVAEVTDPKVIPTFSERMLKGGLTPKTELPQTQEVVSEKEITPMQESSSSRELLSLRKLAGKVGEMIRWQFSQQAVTRTLRKLAEQEHLVWMAEVKKEQQKVDQQLLAHRQLFLRQRGILLHPVVKVFNGQYVEGIVIKDSEGNVLEDNVYMDREVTIRPLTIEERDRLDIWRMSSQKHDGKSPLDRFYYATGLYDGNETTCQWIDNLTPGVIPQVGERLIPVNSSAPVIRDARIKEKPIEETQQANQISEGDKSVLSLTPYRKFPSKPSILERLLAFSKANESEEDKDFHVLIFGVEGINDVPFEAVVTRYVRMLNKLRITDVEPAFYVAHIRGLANDIGTDKYHSLDMFSQISIPRRLAMNLVTDLTNVANMDAIYLQYSNEGIGNIGIYLDLPSQGINSGLPQFLQGYKGSARYLQIMASDSIQQFIGTTKEPEWVLAKKLYDVSAIDGKARDNKGLVAQLNIYYIDEVKDMMGVISGAGFSENADNNLGIVTPAMPLIIEGRSKPTSVIPLGAGSQIAA